MRTYDQILNELIGKQKKRKTYDEIVNRKVKENLIGFNTINDDLNLLGTKINNIYNGWHDADTMKKTKSSVENMYKRLTAFQEYNKNYGEGSVDITETVNAYKTVLDEWEGLTSYYGKFKDENAYKRAKREEDKAAFKKEKMKTDDLDAIRAEIADMENEYAYWDGIAKKNMSVKYKQDGGLPKESYKDYTIPKSNAQAIIKGKGSKYGGYTIKELQDLITEKKTYLEEATTIQNDIKYSEKAKSGEGKLGLNKWYEDKANFDEEKAKREKEESEMGFLVGLGKEILTRLKKGQISSSSAFVGRMSDTKSEDISYQEPKENWTKEELYEFGARYYESPEIAFDYAAKLNNQKAMNKKNETLETTNAWATKNVGTGAVATVGSIPAKATGLYDLFDDFTDWYAGRRVIVEEPSVSPFEWAQSSTGAIGNKLNEYGALDERIPVVGGKGWGDVYGLGTSIAESALTTAAGGPMLTAVTFFGQGAAGAVADATERGATIDEALSYGTIVGAAEMVSEYIGADKLVSIGKKGIKSAFSEILKQAGAEGLEETFSAVVENIADDVIMGDNSKFNSLLQQYKLQGLSETDAVSKAWRETVEDIAYNGLSGALSGGIHGAIAMPFVSHEHKKTGKNTIENATDLNKNESQVVDRIYENKIAEQEAKGKKLTQRERAKIKDDVINRLERGEIDINTIEEVLGGETYKRYKNIVDNETALQKEFDTLNKMKQGEMTGEQLDRRAELKQQLEELKNTTTKSDLKTKLSDEVFSLVKDSKLAESYNQRAKRGQAFTADLTQYDTKYHDTIKKAVDSGILNDTRRTHEFVDLIANVSADKGVLFDFTNNERIAETGFAVEGATVNGYVDKATKTIGLNIDSNKVLEKTVGHEVTHILEGTEFYDVLQTTITEYAKSKGDYDGRLETLTELYKNEDGYQGEEGIYEIKKEVVADLVGDYLFTDTEFIHRLSTQNRNVFEKIYDEIKYLCKVVTAGSKEARQLEKVKKAFDDAYRESGKAQKNTTENSGGVRYSLIGRTVDGTGIYKTNYPKNTQKSIKQADLISLVQNVWSNNPITLEIVEEGTTRKIVANFNPELSDRSDLSKIAFGNRKGNASDQRMTLDLSSDLYQIAADSKYQYSKYATPKPENPAHDGVIKYHYFLTNLIYKDNENNYIDCHMNIDVKQNTEGNWFYSFGIEKGSVPQTLLAAVTENSAALPIDSISNPDENVKQKQLDIINNTNPAPNTYNTWVRSEEFIDTLWDGKENRESGKAQKNTTEKGGVRYSLSDIEIPTRAQLESKGAIKVIDISIAKTKGTYAERRAQIKREMQNIISVPYLNKDTQTMIFLTTKSYEHVFSNSGGIQLNAAEHLPELIENAVLTHAEENTHGSEYATGVYTFFAAVKADKIRPVKLKVKEFSYRGQELPKNIKEYFDKNLQDYAASYDTVVLEVEEIEESSIGSVKDIDKNNLFLDPNELSEISIADLLNLVNGSAKKYVPDRAVTNTKSNDNSTDIVPIKKYGDYAVSDEDINLVEKNDEKEFIDALWGRKENRESGKIQKNKKEYFYENPDSQSRIINILTGEEIDENTYKVLEKLNNGENVTVDELSNLKEVQEGAAKVDEMRQAFIDKHPEFANIPQEDIGTYLLRSDERKKLRNNIIAERLQEGSFSNVDKNGNDEYNGNIKKGKRLDIVIGLPASGKSTAVVNTLSEFYQSAVIDSDIIKSKLPEFNDGWGAMLVYEESSNLNLKLLEEAMKLDNNIILPIVGSKVSSVENYIAIANEFGYDINIHLNELPNGKAIGRMLMRYFDTGRFINPSFAIGYGDKPTTVYEQIKRRGDINGYSRWNNDVEKGQRPILQEISDNNRLYGAYNGADGNRRGKIFKRLVDPLEQETGFRANVGRNDSKTASGESRANENIEYNEADSVKESAFLMPRNIDAAKTVENYTEEQYNNFGWVRYNEVLTAAEYNTLLSRYADYKHNRHNYPITRFGEAVIHSNECPDVLMYAKGEIGNPQITKVVRINADESNIKEMILRYERGQNYSAFEMVRTCFGEWILDINYRKDYDNYREYERRLAERGSGESRDSNNFKQHDRGRSARENTEYDEADSVNESAFLIPRNIDAAKTVENYTEEQYNNFGWVRYNEVLTAVEYNTLLSRYADYKHNRHNYPITRFNEAVIHSNECPDVLMYAKGEIGNPQITKVVRINEEDPTDFSIIREEVLSNEYKQMPFPFSFIEEYYGQEVLIIDEARDYASYREYERGLAERRTSQDGDTFGRAEHNRGRSARENTEYDEADSVNESAFLMPQNSDNENETNAGQKPQNLKEVIEQFCISTGRQVVFEDLRNYTDGFGNVSPDGYIDKNNVIHINLYAANPIGFVLKHEITHFCEGSSYYNDFAKQVRASSLFDKWLKQKVNSEYLWDAYDKYKEIIKSQQPYLKKEEIDCEIIADFVSEMMFMDSGSGIITMVSQTDTKKRNAVVQFILDLISYIKKKLNGQDYMTVKLSVLEDGYRRMLSDAIAREKLGVYKRANGEQFMFVRCDELDKETAKRIRLARTMERKGISTERIFEIMKMFRDPWGEWVDFISDNGPSVRFYPLGTARSNDKKTPKGVRWENNRLKGKLKCFLTHPELYAAWPGLMDLEIQFVRGGLSDGQYSSKHRVIWINEQLRQNYILKGDNEIKAVLFREIQHVVQDNEGKLPIYDIEKWAELKQANLLPLRRSPFYPLSFTYSEAYLNEASIREAQLTANLYKYEADAQKKYHTTTKGRMAFYPHYDIDEVLTIDDDGKVTTMRENLEKRYKKSKIPYKKAPDLNEKIEMWTNRVESGRENEFDSDDEYIYNNSVVLISPADVTKDVLSTKPLYSPRPKKWLEKGGVIEVYEDGTWEYTTNDGTMVQYINGFPDFIATGKVRQVVDIGGFTNRTADVEKANKLAPMGQCKKGNVWHHSEDGHTMIEILEDIHKNFTHIGGVYLMKGKTKNGI